MKFYYTRGGFLIEPVLKLFVSKVIVPLLNRIEIWGQKESTLSNLGKIQNLFMKHILALSKGAPAALSQIELAIFQLGHLPIWQSLNHWQRGTPLASLVSFVFTYCKARIRPVYFFLKPLYLTTPFQTTCFSFLEIMLIYGNGYIVRMLYLPTSQSIN